MPSAIIADDEDLPRSDLRRLLHEVWPELDIVAECEHGHSALAAVGQLHPDIAFLDIRMPGLSGLDVARALSGRCHAVFTTAYDSYALEAFNAGAIDYVLKPIARDRLLQTVTRLQERLSVAAPAPDLSQLLLALQQQLRGSEQVARVRWISASVGDTIKLFPIEEVLFFESDEKYTRVVTRDDEAHVRKPLKDLMVGLDPEEFWQIHRGTVVRANAITRIRRDELGHSYLELRGKDDKLKISSAYLWRFKGI